jgi:hypothetical protein
LEIGQQDLGYFFGKVIIPEAQVRQSAANVLKSLVAREILKYVLPKELAALFGHEQCPETLGV